MQLIIYSFIKVQFFITKSRSRSQALISFIGYIKGDITHSSHNARLLHVTQFAYGYTETACSTYIRVLKIILTNKNRTNPDADQEYEAACRKYMQQASIVGRVRYVTLYIADKPNKRLRTRPRLGYKKLDLYKTINNQLQKWTKN